jgi:aryl-alcohol dehydrogenase-like predicted oxidoreductase
MTWGSQNTEQEAHSQIDCAIARGVNFIDTAEMYPTTPLDASTQGMTESCIGSWIKKSGRRGDLVIATKVTGEGNQPYIHQGMPISPKKISLALEDSLRRLQTDYIDLYQLHWPNRGSYHFRQWWQYDPSQQNTEQTIDNIREVLFALQRYVDEGKIRTVGLSNESCWGTLQYLQTARDNQLPRVVSVQNEYNLLCRLYDTDFAELSHHEDLGLLTYSPLAAGLLSGKYANGQVPAGSRRSLNDNLGGRYQSYSALATDAYLEVAQKHGLSAAQMALAFCIERPFMTSTIIGATSLSQLETNLGAADLSLSDDVYHDITEVYRQYPRPM